MVMDAWRNELLRPSQLTSVLLVYDFKNATAALEIVEPKTFEYQEADKRIITWINFEGVAPFIEVIENFQLKLEAYAKIYKLIWHTCQEAISAGTLGAALPESVKVAQTRIARIVKYYLRDPALNALFSLNLRDIFQMVWQFSLNFKRWEFAS